ncbi:hypothetical protein Pfo_017165 [Paulownia fortunei]|nr:hypothetical protein Pfo_017165 [Paulownia fortunei]
MEVVHKANTDDYKTLDAKKFILGKRYFTLEEVEKVGGQTSLPAPLRLYNPDEEPFSSSQMALTTTFPRGFALEILQVYSGPPVIVYKFRHWGYMEGPFKGHAPTGELVEFFGTAICELDEHSRIVKVQFFCDGRTAGRFN